MSDTKRWRLAAASLLALVSLWATWAFSPILHGYFLSDDFVPLVLFREWQDEGRLANALAAKFWGSLDAGTNLFYRPLSYLTFAINYLASGLDAKPWMATEVALHVANGLLVGAIGARLADEKPGARALAAATLGAALFLFAAPGVEVLAWISGRFDATATFFTLLTCLIFLSSRRALDLPWWLSLASAEAAFLCKESAAIVPFAILALARLRADAVRAPTFAARWIAAARHAAPWLALAALYLLSRYAFFGSATRVYGTSNPLASMLSAGYWRDVLDSAPPWLAAQFRP
ncbi:MAG TPA: hypothetical protein VII36_09975, partial [Usitatibacter sp.]